jgi:hypothetical protein
VTRPHIALPTLVLSSLLLGLAGCGPTFVFPGGELDGEVAPTPSDWTFAADVTTIQLETRPTDPYSVNITCAVVDGRLYISAGDNYSQWAENIDADPNVRLRIEGAVYELRAVRVTNAAEMAGFATAWTDKVSFGRDPTELDEAFVYRLEPR